MSVSDKDSLVVARSERTPPAAKLERTPADKPLPAPERLAPAPDRPMSFGRTVRAARPMGADRQFHRTRGISPLTRRILFFNVFALIILIGGVLWVQSSRAGLVQERIAGIRDQALIVAGALAEYTAIQERRTIDTAQAEPLVAPADRADASARARLHDERPAPDRHAQPARAQHRGHGIAAAAGIGEPGARLFRAHAWSPRNRSTTG